MEPTSTFSSKSVCTSWSSKVNFRRNLEREILGKKDTVGRLRHLVRLLRKVPAHHLGDVTTTTAGAFISSRPG